MKLLVSCLGYDSGKSGLSAYMKNVLANLKECEDEITVVVEADSVNDFSGFKQICVPKLFSKSLSNYLWSIFVLPFIARKFDCVLVLAGNRRFVPFGKTSKVGVIHDLSQYRVADKYGALRMFQLFKVQPIFKIPPACRSTKKLPQHCFLNGAKVFLSLGNVLGKFSNGRLCCL